MPRQDLLALTLDDLVVLSNRGLVKRASKELETGELSFELIEDDAGTVTLQWSDDIQCVLPGNSTVSNSQCSCSATTICRHLIRSVLAYQQAATAQVETQESPVDSPHLPICPLSPEGAPSSPSPHPPIPPSLPWNPGNITDEELAKHYKKAVLSRIRQSFESGHVIELIRTDKPTAQFHTLSFTLRFLVPGDIRYTHCDCAESAPCSHVPLAVWAFRLLKDEQLGGVVSSNTSPLPIPISLLDEIERALEELAESGIANSSQAEIARFRRLEARCREDNLVWLAEIIAELLQEHDRYISHDARFSPTRVVELVGELCIRCDAIRNDTGAVPQLFIRGSSADQLTEMGAARLVGLGCGVRVNRRSVTLSAYLQDTDSGTVIAICRDFINPTDDANSSPKTFWQLAQTPVMKGISLASLGAGQLLIKGGKRSPNYQFILGRAKATANPQTFNWESLRAPVLAENFREIYTRLSTLPPASLRPRRLTENFYVCAIANVEAVEFSPAEQLVSTSLLDRKGDRATLIHPYTSRTQEGTEALFSTLQKLPPETLRFVAGQVYLGSTGLVIMPISLVFQQGATRTILQPWIEKEEAQEHTSTGKYLTTHSPLPITQSQTTSDSLASFSGQVIDAISELFLTGLQRASEPTTRYWQQLHRFGASLGFVRLLDPIVRLVEMLEQKSKSIHWDGQSAAQAALEIALLAKLTQDELPPS